MTQRLTPELEEEVRADLDVFYGVDTSEVIRTLLAEIDALRAELAESHAKVELHQTVKLEMHEALEACRRDADLYARSSVAYRDLSIIQKEELAGAEERGRQQAVALLNGYMSSKLRNRGEPLYLSEICELRDQLVRTGTTPPDAGK